jgi:hypothetical protein
MSRQRRSWHSDELRRRDILKILAALAVSTRLDAADPVLKVDVQTMRRVP